MKDLDYLGTFRKSSESRRPSISLGIATQIKEILSPKLVSRSREVVTDLLVQLISLSVGIAVVV
jgi:hypothetical protein